ncbi:MAG: dihydrofolate reductase family protein [Beijerinckiaceae bacterium]
MVLLVASVSAISARMKIFIAQSIDGYIAGEGDSLAHLEPFQGNDYGYEEMIRSISSVVVGRRTFDVIFPDHGWMYPAHVSGVVFTRRPLPENAPAQVRAMSDCDVIARDFPDAFIDGGATTIAAFMWAGHVTQAEIFTLPVLLGSGVRLFPRGPTSNTRWDLIDARTFPCGTVKTRYRLQREASSAAVKGP